MVLLSKSREQKIIEVLEPLAAEHGFELVDIEIAGVGKGTILRVFLDKPELMVDDLAGANNWIGQRLDELDPFRGSYLLEVSSPGIDRPLRTLEHFQRFSGQEARLHTEALQFEGGNRARWSGILRGTREGCVLLENNGVIHNLDFKRIKKAHLVGKVDFKAAEQKAAKEKGQK
jgi:ribosome maturation factor RimP